MSSTHHAAPELPQGTVTFLLTDVAGSTRMWETEPHDTMRDAIVRHYELLDAAVTEHGGLRPQEQGEGDSIVAVFVGAADAVAAATAAQVALSAEPWPTATPIRVRMAIHTGEAHLRDAANYAGQAIIRAARIRAAGHGGQVLVSGTTRELVVDQTRDRFAFRSLGQHTLRDLDRPEHVWQLDVPGLNADFPDLVTGRRPTPNSLPAPLSSFVGRGAQLSELVELVATDRLVTVIGSGGAGKTRLAREVGMALLDRFPSGVWWTELAPTDDDGVEPTIRSAFGISHGASAPLEESVFRQLDGRRCLLIVDNCEHVAERVAGLVGRLLARCPTLHVLATSRVSLGIGGERPWRIPALTSYDPTERSDLEATERSDLEATERSDLEAAKRAESVALFVDRARRARPGFELGPGNVADVAAIGRRLEGIPLAIELAAARCRMLDPRRILAGLDDALRILSGGSPTLMSRQQTLEASVDWSYHLLSPDEQTLLRRLSVFVDGWTLEGAEGVCAAADLDGDLDPRSVFDALDRLVDHSLVHAVDTSAGVRFGMLETVRQFASARLAADEREHHDLRRRHAAYFCDWVGSLRDELLRDQDLLLVGSVVADRANIVAATQYAIDHGDAVAACHTLDAIGYLQEEMSWAPVALTILGQTDRLIGIVDPIDAWRVHAVHQRCQTFRGEPLAELETLERMRSAAEAADQPLGVAAARFRTIVTFSMTGAPVLEEMADVGADVARLDPAWAGWAWATTALMTAYCGRPDLAATMRARVSAPTDGSSLGAMLRISEGMEALYRGDPRSAVASLDAAIRTGRLHHQTYDLAAGMRAFAIADLGADPDDDTESVLRRNETVDGNVIAGIAADAIASHRHFSDGDLAAAAAVHRSVLERWAAVGVAGSALTLTYPYAAAGIADEVVPPTGDVTLLVESETYRSIAEQRLRAGDPTGALDHARHALGVESSHGLHRGAVQTLELVARVLSGSGRCDEAVRLLGTCRAFRVERGLVAPPHLGRLVDDAAGVCRSALGERRFEELFAAGTESRFDEVANDVHGALPEPPAS